MILDNLIDRVGNWNPQIFRELKERLTLKNIGIATTASVLIQVFVWVYFDSQLPVQNPHIKETYNRYCRNSLIDKYSDLCSMNAFGEFNVNWQQWYSDIFLCLSWILPLGLILGSVYLLVADLVQEEKRGTLNFIRLSPQSAQTIFIGKILGVPSLVYLAAALMLPFHLLIGMTVGASIPLLATWYLTIGSIWFLLSSAATLYVLLGGIQAILTVIAVAYPVGIPLLAINSLLSATISQAEWLNQNNENMSWFWLRISSSAILFYTFAIGCCLLANYWIWQALERRYLKPTATILSKSQSYLANLHLQIWFAGFALPLVTQSATYYQEGAIVSMAIADFMALFLLIPLLLPSKQALQDWSRYRREHVTHQERKFWQRDLVQDLINNDQSPTILAIAINLGMAIVLWIPIGLFTFNNVSESTRFAAGLCLAASLILIYTAIAHWGLFLNLSHKKRNLWIIALVGGTMLLPLVAAFVLSPNRNPTGLAAILLLFSPFAPIGILNLSGGTILATFMAQLALLAGLTQQLRRKLQITGQSQSKELAATS